MYDQFEAYDISRSYIFYIPSQKKKQQVSYTEQKHINSDQSLTEKGAEEHIIHMISLKLRLKRSWENF